MKNESARVSMCLFTTVLIASHNSIKQDRVFGFQYVYPQISLSSYKSTQLKRELGLLGVYECFIKSQHESKRGCTRKQFVSATFRPNELRWALLGFGATVR